LHWFLIVWIFFLWSFVLLKVEAEKLFHLRLAAILDDVDAEVEFSLFALILMLTYQNHLEFIVL
jgi:hypothetical protein